MPDREANEPEGGETVLHDENLKSESPSEFEAPKVARKRRARREEFQDDVPFNAMARTSTIRLGEALDNAKLAARIADDSRGKDILLLDLRSATALVDYFVIVSANSRRLGHAIASEIDQEMKKRSELKLGMEGSEDASWILIDYGDFVVHVFSEEARKFYSLEDIWGDAEQIDWRDPNRPQRVPVAPEVEDETPPAIDEDDESSDF